MGTKRISELSTAVREREFIASLLDWMQQNPEGFVGHPGVDFTRRNKLSLRDTVEALFSMEAECLQKGLRKLFPERGTRMTKSAFCQRRGLIKFEAFKALLDRFNEEFEHLDTKNFRGKKLLAVDGTKVSVSYNREADSWQPGGSSKGFNQLLVTAVMDVLNKTFLDLEINPIRKGSERRDAYTIFNRKDLLEHSAILTMDRGYGGFGLLEFLKRKNIYYVCRLSRTFCTDLPYEPLDRMYSHPIFTRQTKKNVALMREGKASYLPGPSKFGKKKILNTWPFESEYTFTSRVVRIRLDSGELETLMTNLPSEYTTDDLKELYRLRWGIETAFRDLKYTMKMTAFHARREDFVWQEILVRFLLYNFASRIVNSVIHSPVFTKNHVYRVNFKMAVEICWSWFWAWRSGAPPPVEEDFLEYIEIVRPGRKDERKEIKFKPVVPMQYRIA